MLAHPSQASCSSSTRRDDDEDTVRRCVDEAARRAARSILHLEFDCLRAILDAHVRVAMATFRGDAPLEHWVNRVLRNRVIDLVKFECTARKEEATTIDPAELDVADPARGPEHEVALDELRRRIEDHHGATREGRILLLLLSGEAETVTQAARILRWNHPTALARLRKHPVVQDLLRARI